MRRLMFASLLGLYAAAAPLSLAQSTTLAKSAREAALRRPEPAAPARPARIDPDDREAARSDYLLHCSGCHGSDGAGHRLGRIPQLADRIGHFLSLPDARAYLVQVPGLNGSGLDDATIARLMNWLLPAFGGASLPPGFEPYRADEVNRARRQRPLDISARRRLLARQLAEAGRPVDY